MVQTSTGRREKIVIDPVAAAVPLRRMLKQSRHGNMADLIEALGLLGYDADRLKTDAVGLLIVKGPEELFELVREDLYGLGHEQLHVAALSRFDGLLAKRMVYQGTVDGIQRLEPRDVFRDALLTGAEYVVLFHNHPSGRIQPSRLDKRTTKDIFRVGKMLGIEIIDHIICHNDRAFSMRRADMLPKLSRRIKPSGDSQCYRK